MKQSQLSRYWNTVRFMKPKQINYRLFYILRNKLRKKRGFKYTFSKKSVSAELILLPGIYTSGLLSTIDQKKIFSFLNLSHTFEDEIDWNYSGLGKLWTYNLNYFEYLLQRDIHVEDGMALLDDFIANIEQNKDGMEPFPIALRGINWIKFLSSNQIKRQYIDDSLYAQYYILMDNLEYHLLGNHLLENGFSLLFGAYYFQDQNLFHKAKTILTEELHEQILDDGAHFELTPMYHQIMLFRVLDCYNLMVHNSCFQDVELQALLKTKAEKMLGWLENIMFQNGKVPYFNDTTEGIAPLPEELIAYASQLELVPDKVPLNESGYRKFVTDKYEMIIDIGQIGPDYIPGHAHSDTFNFELYINNKPIIVDTGISTYESNARRFLERSTKAHNTVVVDDLDQSEVWSSFRVARRANVVAKEESENFIRATHDGYKRIGVMHTREVYCDEQEIKIVDKIDSDRGQIGQCCAYLHFSDDVEIEDVTEKSIFTKNAIFLFEGLKNLELVDITIAKGYNKLISSKAAKISFERELLTLIDIIV